MAKNFQHISRFLFFLPSCLHEITHFLLDSIMAGFTRHIIPEVIVSHCYLYFAVDLADKAQVNELAIISDLFHVKKLGWQVFCSLMQLGRVLVSVNDHSFGLISLLVPFIHIRVLVQERHVNV